MTVHAAQLVGAVLGIEQGEVFGWVVDLAAPARCLSLTLLVNGQPAGIVRADETSDTFIDAGLPTGARGFRVRPVIDLIGGQALDLALLDENARAVVIPHARLRARDGLKLACGELDAGGVLGLPRPRGVTPLHRAGLAVARRLAARSGAQRSARAIAPAVTARHIDGVRQAGRVEATALDQRRSLRLPVADEPRVSVILPVHDQFELTLRCLSSIVLSGNRLPFEVVLVDDASTDATIAIESIVANLRVVRPPENLGFVHACRAGADVARGEYLCLLNNDTVVGPRWLDELQAVFERFDNVGASGSRLVYPDGRLQDAGGIVWGSGIPWNAGHGDDPDAPEFNYVRDVDYLTGASLMVSRSAWDEVDGFSEAYAPAYYEDTDLAYKLRAHGYRTLYCPQSSVVHYEGMSNGTSTDSGIKRHQLINAERFVNTWQAAFAQNGRSGRDIRCARDRLRGLRVLMFDIDFPRLGRDAGSYAAVQEIRLLTELGCKITFLPVSLKHAGCHVDALQRLGVECLSRPWVRSVPEFLEKNGGEFDLVYITRYVVAERVLSAVRKHCRAKVALNIADLHFLRELRTGLLSDTADTRGPVQTRKRELDILSRVDAVLTYNETERHVIASHLMRADHLHACPWVLEPAGPAAPFEQRSGIAFLGGFGHPPNGAAMDWFVDHVMPRLAKRRPDIQLFIFGSAVPADECWSAKDNVIVRGHAPSLDSVFGACRVFVAPLLSGAGIKGKVLDSVAYGVPAVLSPIAAEATGLVDEVHGRIVATDAASVDLWVEAIIGLHDDRERWVAASAALARHRDRHFSRLAGLVAMRRVLQALELDGHLPAPRGSAASLRHAA